MLLSRLNNKLKKFQEETFYDTLADEIFTFLVITGVVISIFLPADWTLRVTTGVVISIFSLIVFCWKHK